MSTIIILARECPTLRLENSLVGIIPLLCSSKVLKLLSLPKIMKISRSIAISALASKLRCSWYIVFPYQFSYANTEYWSTCVQWKEQHVFDTLLKWPLPYLLLFCTTFSWSKALSSNLLCRPGVLRVHLFVSRVCTYSNLRVRRQ